MLRPRSPLYAAQIAALAFLLLGPGPTRAGLVLSPSGSEWGILDPHRSDRFVLYSRCDAAGENCVEIGAGESGRAGYPIALQDLVGPAPSTLRARVCRATAQEEDCSDASAPSAPFHVDPTLGAGEVIVYPDAPAADSVEILPGETVSFPLDLPMLPPFSAELRVQLALEPEDAYELRVHPAGRPWEVLRAHRCSGSCEPEVRLDVGERLTEARIVGTRAVVVVIENRGALDPIGVGGQRPLGPGTTRPVPHLRLGPAGSERVDSDGDGVPDNGSSIAAVVKPCDGAAWDACDDSCPNHPDPAQADSDGDGIGDLCDLVPWMANAEAFDRDRDLAPDPVDNCAYVFNPQQRDSDGDGIGDLCDNCPNASNWAQFDRGSLLLAAANGTGDACECGDVNGDGVANLSDALAMGLAVVGLSPATGFDVEKCNMVGEPGGGAARCDTSDMFQLIRLLLGIDAPPEPICGAALGAI